MLKLKQNRNAASATTKPPSGPLKIRKPVTKKPLKSVTNTHHTRQMTQISRQSAAKPAPKTAKPFTPTDKTNTNNATSTPNLAKRIRQSASQKAPPPSFKTSSLNTIVVEAIEPPPQYDCEVPRLVSSLRQVLAHDGPVSIGKMDDVTPFLDPKAFQKMIPQPGDINWDAIPPFITSSRDPSLYHLAHSHGAHFMGSTSSTSPLLSQIHYAITSHAAINTKSLSHWFANAATSHTRASVKPIVSLLRKRNEHIWGIDNAPSGDPKQNQILIDLGKSLERHLTFEWSEFDRLFLRHYNEAGELLPHNYTPDEIQESEAHAFLKAGHLLLRSQLDCEDDAVPSDRKIFDLKTRATLPIRLDVMNHENYLDYKVTARSGLYNSFEREYYDMGRSAFLKYSFQCRIGGMGGVFVAYHNTREMFGFEYIPVEKMDSMIYGSSNKANFVFRHSLNIMEEIMERVTKDMGKPGERPTKDTIRLTVDAQDGRLVVFAEEFPHVDLDNPAALDKALECQYRGHVYIDWLDEDQARAALVRRGLSDKGTRPELISRLEAATVVPSVLYQLPSEEFILEQFEKNHFRVYNVHTNIFDERSGGYIEWPQITDAVLPDVSIRYSLREINQAGNKAALARRYHQFLAEHNLIDRKSQQSNEPLPKDIEDKVFADFRAKLKESKVGLDGLPLSPDDPHAVDEDSFDRSELMENPEVQMALKQAQIDYMAEVVDSLVISGVSIPVTRADEVKMSNKKLLMDHLMNQVNHYNSLNDMQDGTQKDEAAASIKMASFQSGSKTIREMKQLAANGNGEGSPHPVQATSRRTL